jgi:hypothetical protein
MEKFNACIVSYFMENISPKTVELQSKVVQELNPSKYPHLLVKGDLRHGVFMDYFWVSNGVPNSGVFEKIQDHKIQKQYDYDIVLFLDIDCIPLQKNAIDLYIQKASQNILVGNVQRSNHLQNNKHVFAAPSALALSRSLYTKIGKPSALETERSDVAEEYTWECERLGESVEYYMPLRYDRNPQESEHWNLADGMPVYGQGTTFGDEENGDLFYHNFQIRFPGQQELFQAKCQSILDSL